MTQRMCGKRALAVVLLAGIASTSAMAEDAGAYVGVEVANSKFSEFDTSDIEPGTTIDRTSVAYKLFAGYSLNKYFAVEGAYTDGAKIKYEINNTLAVGQVDTTVSTFGVAAIGKWPATDRLSIFGKVGLAHWKGKVESDARVGSAQFHSESSESGNKLFYGAGLAFAVTSRLDLRFEYELQKLDPEVDLKLIGLGLSVRF